MGSNKSRTVQDVLEVMYQMSVHNYETDCWLWQGQTNIKGYGQIYFSGKTQSVHRVSYKHFTGDPKEQWVLHKCDTPNCWNPAHLFLGTHQDNVKDRQEKGRGQRGIRSGHAKLTEEQVLEIRASALSYPTLAKKYGVCSQTIFCIINRHSWKHI